MEFVDSVGVRRSTLRLYGFYVALRLGSATLTNQRSATEILSDQERVASREIGQITTNPTEYYLKDLNPYNGNRRNIHGCGRGE